MHTVSRTVLNGFWSLSLYNVSYIGNRILQTFKKKNVNFVRARTVASLYGRARTDDFVDETRRLFPRGTPFRAAAAVFGGKTRARSNNACPGPRRGHTNLRFPGPPRRHPERARARVAVSPPVIMYTSSSSSNIIKRSVPPQMCHKRPGVLFICHTARAAAAKF